MRYVGIVRAGLVSQDHVLTDAWNDLGSSYDETPSQP
jgi:hypothetical protein